MRKPYSHQSVQLPVKPCFHEICSTVSSCQAVRLSFSQEKLWLHQKLDPRSTAYNLPRVFHLNGRLNLDALEKSFKAVIQRHDVFRSRFIEQGGIPFQVLEKSASFSLPMTDLSALGDDEQHDRLDGIVKQVVLHEFDLSSCPALVAHVIRLGESSHVLAFCMHHIISDAWSNAILARDLADAYRAALNEPGVVKLPSLEVSFSEHAGNERLSVERGELERAIEYWNGYTSGMEMVINLPTQSISSHAQSPEGASVSFEMSERTQLALERFCRRERFTPFVVMHAAWQILLARYSGQHDFPVCVPSAGRDDERFHEVIGFFVNTQVYRARLKPEMTLLEVCRQVRSDAIAAMSHRHVPLEFMNLSRTEESSFGRSSMFQVMFDLQMSGGEKIFRLEGLSVSAMETFSIQPKFDLLLDVLVSDDHLRGVLEYRQDRFSEAFVCRLVEHYKTVVDRLLANPGSFVGDVDFLDETEVDELHAWGSGEGEVTDDFPVHKRFENHALRKPDAAALIFSDKTLGYGNLNERANRLAHHLISLGVGPEVRVGIAVERSIGMVVGLLAILKAGGAYVPLDPDYPADRLRYMIEDSNIGLLLTQTTLLPKLADLGIEMMPDSSGSWSANRAESNSADESRSSLRVLDLDAADVSQYPVSNPEVVVHGENLAYVIYTSGSTGRPKGAANRHRALYNRLMWMQSAYSLNESDTVLQKTPFSFDVSVWEFFWPLMVGARLAVAAPGDHRDPARLVDLIQKHQVTTLHFVPSMLQAFLAHQGIEACSSLKRIICSGEALPAEAQNEVFRRLPQAALHNLYGPTEAAIDVTHWTCRDDGRSQMPIGTPISGIQTYVLDTSLNLVPQGVAGELYLGGVGLARGYLHRSGLSSERFVADPFSREGGRLYRTGDLVRWNAEGQLEYLGRIDHQVKIRGFRIELGEVEAQLLAQPEVREAVVVADEGPGGARLVAYVSAHSDATIDPSALRERLGGSLPDYMVPGVVVVLEALPLNANGKVDRKALPAPAFDTSEAYEPPQGEVEEKLAAIWSKVLGVERVGRQDNFFELGGHSLLALTLLERMRTQGLKGEIRTLFQKPVLSAFAETLAEGSGRKEVVVPPNLIPSGCTSIRPEMLTLVELNEEEIASIEASVPGGAANIQDIYPLAPLQEGILFHHMLQQQGDTYVTPHLLGFDSRERLEGFIATLNEVIARHDILRTAVLWEGLREPVQVVWREARLDVEWLAIDNNQTIDVATALNEQVDPLHHRIDVRKAPMFRAVAAHDEHNDRWLLQLPSHHLILDHTTLDLLVEEIALIRQGRRDELPEVVPFRNFVAQARLGVSKAEHEAFFQQMLGDVEEPTLPFGLLDVQGDGGNVEEYRLPLDATLCRQIRALARQHGVSAATLFHLAWALVVGRTSGRDDVVFGTVLFGRMQAGAGSDRALGMFINTLPIRIQLGGQTVGAALQATHRSLTALLEHEHASLSLAQGQSGLAGGVPLFSALLNYRYSAEPESDRDSEIWEGTISLGGEERTNYPFGMSVDDLGEEFNLVAQVLPSIGARRVCTLLDTALKGLTAALQSNSPKQQINQLDLLPEDEHALIKRWGVNAGEHVDAVPVHRLFEQKADEQPKVPALIFAEQTLSYQQLNERANQLAHHLVSLGVGPEVRVGIAVERSIGMVVGLLAILKAGGAYVPLDPEYPADRLRYMIEDSRVRLLLTQSSVLQRLSEALANNQSMQMLNLDEVDVSQYPATNPEVAVHGENLAYVIYTSGSTGRPKGTAIRHQALSRCMQWMQQKYQLGSEDTVLHKAPFCFDVSVWEIFWPLTAGIRLVVASPGDHRDPARITELIRHQQVTTLNFVPAMLQAFLAHEGIERETRLRYVICGGEAMPAATQREALQRLDGVSLQNLYGPTETTIHVTQWQCRDDGQSLVPIGRPISATSAHVLDEMLQPVPVGVAGELYIGGDLLARGYLGRQALSAERFVADPFSTEGARLYRTGDLVRWNTEGQLEYLGRIDHQVKIRGFRIELGEVEAQLLAQPEVREAVVVADEGPGGVRLVAYVSPRSDATIDPSALRERLGVSLPDYMMPSAIMLLQTLPLNANGKVDRRALPAPAFDTSEAYEPPQGEVEEKLAAIWSEVLGVERVGRQDNFFELGGHSLLALTLLERMRTQGLKGEIRTLFQKPVLSAFAETLGEGAGRKEVVVPPNPIPSGCTSIRPEMLTLVELNEEEIASIEASVPGGAANIQDIYPLAPLQEGILFHHMLQQQGDTYVTPHLLGFDSRERLEGFIATLNAVIARHDILRTAVLWEGLREPVQVVWRQARLDVEWLAIDNDQTIDVATALSEQVDPLRHRIDVRKAPMFRAVAAWDQNNDRWLLQLPSHHLILDHTTLDLLVEEIALIRQGRRDELPEVVPFRNFVGKARLGVTKAEHEAFFQQMLGDVEEPTLPFGLLDVQGDGGNVEEYRLPLDATLCRQIRALARQHGVSAASLFHLAWALVVGRTSGRDDVVFGTVLFGRMQAGAGSDRALGMFINTLPIRIKLGGQTVAAALQATHRSLTALLEHEHASLSLAQGQSGLAGGVPLFSALLNYRYIAEPDLDKDAVIWEGISSLGGEERTNYPVDLSVDDLGEGFELVAQVVRSVDARRVCQYTEQVLKHLVHLLLARKEQSRLSSIECVSGTEKALLKRWGQGPDTDPIGEWAHQAFERQACQTPEATALIFEGQLLSYKQLNQRVNQLAHHLIELGVGPEVRVGIAIERSIPMVVGLLATLKAGGAYVPLDPGYPADRLRYMIEDSGISLLLTNSNVLQRLPEVVKEDQNLRLLDLDAVDVEQNAVSNPEVELHGENLAYVIYTSGSTGKPKGVGISHHCLATHARVSVGFFELVPQDRVLQFSTLNFDGCIEQLFAPLICGASVVLRGQDLWDSNTFHQKLIDYQISVVDLTTAYWFLLIQDFARHNLNWYGKLRQVHAGGESMPPEGLKLWKKAGLEQVKLLNTYGPTEATVTASVLDCKTYVSGERDLPSQMPIGGPLARRRIYVVDESLNVVPPGVSGELLIGGDLLARGYLGRQALTAERFVADSFSSEGGRLYRTGDLVKWNAEGQLEYLGRIDHQVKIRGFRIELGEVETQLLSQPGVREAVVVAYKGPMGSQLVAYVSGHAGLLIDVSALRGRLSATLPDYMVPSVIMVLDALPLNANGKVDRKELPAPEVNSGVAYDPPQGEIEEQLAAIWSEVLGVERVGRQDNFFDLGGNSLSALKLVSLLEKRMPYLKESLKSFYKNPFIKRFIEEDEACFSSDFYFGNLKPRCFILPDGWGSVIDFTEMSRFLKKDGIDLVGVSLSRSEFDPLHRSLDDLADQFASKIISVDPAGPYRLMGWSLGGALAPMVSDRIKRSGGKVDLVISLDPFVPKTFCSEKPSFRSNLEEFLSSLVPDDMVDSSLLAGYKKAIDSFDGDREAALSLIQNIFELTVSDLSPVYSSLAKDDLVDLFDVSSYINMLCSGGVRSHFIDSKSFVIWSDEKNFSERNEFMRLMGFSDVSSVEVRANHMEIVRSRMVFEMVKKLLSCY